MKIVHDEGANKAETALTVAPKHNAKLEGHSVERIYLRQRCRQRWRIKRFFRDLHYGF